MGMNGLPGMAGVKVLTGAAAAALLLGFVGATPVLAETIEASLQLSEALLVDIGVPMGLIIASVHEKRDEYRKMLNRPDALGARVRKARDRLGSSS